MEAACVVSDQALAAERPYLMGYAVFKLRDADLAEDVVQETLVAAIEGKHRFEGRSSLRTWLVAILRNKVFDLLAARKGEVYVDGFGPEDDDDGTAESFFDTHGRWGPGVKPQTWGDPESAMEQRQFWETLEQCLRGMPARLQEVFVLREVIGEPILAICKNLGISKTNCSVMLYRARMRLRPCLDARWFARTR